MHNPSSPVSRLIFRIIKCYCNNNRQSGNPHWTRKLSSKFSQPSCIFASFTVADENGEGLNDTNHRTPMSMDHLSQEQLLDQQENEIQLFKKQSGNGGDSTDISQKQKLHYSCVVSLGSVAGFPQSPTDPFAKPEFL